MTLHPAASRPEQTRGRRHPHSPDVQRNEFQRDRDRIVHSSAFRRLVYKTQVFLNHEGDLFRTRMTHSLEVAQVARSAARLLGLHEDLVEAISLAHDLGHTPFGHAGQDALHACVQAVRPEGGGFEHNFQSLRVVDVLEERYPDHPGLNLSFETREGLLKHCSRRHAAWLEANDASGLGRRFLERTQPSLEAQLCNIADEIAYNAHDLDDGVRSGLLSLEQLRELPALARQLDEVQREFPDLTPRRMLAEVLRRRLTEQIHDLVSSTRRALEAHAPASADEARRRPALVVFGLAIREDVDSTQQFLRRNLYRHPRVVATTDLARQVVRELFERYMDDPAQLPAAASHRPAARVVADYIAGMTDRFALLEHRRMTGRALHWPLVEAAQIRIGGS